MTPITKIRVQSAVIFIIAVLGALFTLPKGPNWIRKEVKLHLGLDLAGGAQLIYEADVKNVPQEQLESAVAGTRDVIERRVNALGVSEPIIQTNKSGDKYRVIVELPGVADVAEAMKKIGDTPVLEFKEQAEPEPLTDAEKKEREEYNRKQKDRAAEELKKLLNQPDEKFAETAKQLSEDPGSKDKGGDLGFAAKGTFVPEFDKVLFEKLKDGEMSKEITETEFGYHLIRRVAGQCKDIKTDKVMPCVKDDKNQKEEVRGRHILFLKAPLDAKPPAEQWKNTRLSGEYLKRAQVIFDPNTGQPIVSLEFNKEGGTLFEEITGRNVNKPVAIFLDGAIISAPKVNEKISGGKAVITGNFSLKESQDLAKRLNAGALPLNIKLISQQNVGAMLGQESLRDSFLAGILGIILVMLFMILYYRLPGIIASAALVIYGFVVITIFKLVPVTLTLSGIAGFLMSVGIAVDANVLIFERLKEELRSGKTLQAAIDEGFSRAWSSIRDSNISTLISAFILMWLGESSIKGFGITLGIGVLVSMFTAITVTRVILKLLAPKGKFKFLFTKL